MLSFIVWFAVFSFASCGLGNLYLNLIRPGQLFDFMQPVLVALSKNKKRVFLYKSLGGCAVCTRQRFADLSFIMLVILFPQKWWAVLPLYCLYGGLLFWAQSFVEAVSVKDEPVRKKSEKLDI